MESFSKQLSAALKKARGDQSQTEFARFLGIDHQATYQRYEEGRVPKADVLHQIATRIGVTMEELLTGKTPNDKLFEAGREYKTPESTREKCHQHLSRVMDSYKADEDRLRWLYVELQRQFPVSLMTRREAEALVDLAEERADKILEGENPKDTSISRRKPVRPRDAS